MAEKKLFVREGRNEYYVWRRGPCRECGQVRLEVSDTRGITTCPNGCLA